MGGNVPGQVIVTVTFSKEEKCVFIFASWY